MRSHPHLVHPMQQKYATSAQQPHPAQSHHPSHQMHDLTPKSRHRRHLIGGGPYMPHQRSFSSSEEDIRGTPEYEGRIQVYFYFPVSWKNKYLAPTLINLMKINKNTSD